jgi:hypothetical protein
MIKSLLFESLAYILSFKLSFITNDGVHYDALDPEETQFLFEYYSVNGFSNAPGNDWFYGETFHYYLSFIQVCLFVIPFSLFFLSHVNIFLL